MASGIDAMRKTIREKEPMRPSTRLATLNGEDLTTTAKRRSCDAPNLIHLLKGDLDWIVMKCLEKDRTRRYETANGLVADLQRHRQNEPVVARPPSTAYRLQKAFRRNRLAFGAGLAVLLALIAGLALAAMGWRQTRVQRDKALHAREGEELQRKAAEASAVTAQEQTKRAEARQAEAHRLLYVADMNLAQNAWDQTHLGRLRELLDATQSFPERGFEWYHWQRQTHLADLTLRTINGISSAVFSPDGQRIATGSAWPSVELWDVASGRALLSIEGARPPTLFTVFSVAFSPDGHRIVAGGGDGTAKVWNAFSGDELVNLKGHTNVISSVTFSPDGQRIATASWDGTAKVWDAASGRVFLTLEVGAVQFAQMKKDFADKYFPIQVTCVAFSPDGRRIVTGSGRFAQVWDAASGGVLLTLDGRGTPIYSAAFSPDGQRIVTGGFRTAIIWDAPTGRELFILAGQAGMISSVAFSPDGDQIATGSTDGTVKLWAVLNGQELRTIKAHNGGVSSVAFSPDGQRLVTAGGDEARVWDILGNKGLAAHGVTAEELRRDDDMAADKGLAALVEHRNAHHLSTPIAFSLDGKRIAASASDQVRVWDAVSERELLALKATNGVFALALSPDGRRIVTGGSKTAIVWDTATGHQLSVFTGHSGAITISSVAFSPDGQRILSRGSFTDDGAKVWEADTGRELFTIKGHTNEDLPAGMPIIMSATYSPDGQWILTGSMGGLFEVWDAARGRELFALKGMISSAAYSPDGQRIVSWNFEGTATVWEAASGKELLTLGTHTRTGRGPSAQRTGTTAAFSPDAQRIVTGSTDNTAKVWDAVSGKELLTLKGHGGPVECVAFTPDGQRILTLSNDQSAKLWDAASGREVLTLAANVGFSSNVAFSPDGRWIFAGRDGKADNAWAAARPEQVAQWHAEDTAPVQP